MIADCLGFPREKILWDATKPDGVPRKSLDGSKLAALLPSFQRTPLAEGLRKTIEWYMANKAEADRRA